MCLILAVGSFAVARHLTRIGASGIEDVPPLFIVMAGLAGFGLGMNLFFGLTIGTMAFGHLLAVTTRFLLGMLEGSVAVFYIIGIVLAVPSWLLIYHTRRMFIQDDHGRTRLILNGWIAVTLLALGVHNLPLAAPAFLNIGYQLHSRRVVGLAIAGMAVVVNVGLFIGSLIFLASGQSFEQFR
jgi:hypothetical protein